MHKLGLHEKPLCYVLFISVVMKKLVHHHKDRNNQFVKNENYLIAFPQIVMIIVIIINNGFSGKAAEHSLVVKEYFPYTVALSLCYCIIL